MIILNLLNEDESRLLMEALERNRRVKIEALAIAQDLVAGNPRLVPFTKHDFGIDTLETMIGRLQAEIDADNEIEQDREAGAAL